MSIIDLDELEAKARAATPGPWRITDRRASPDGPGLDCNLSGPGISANIVRCAGSVNSEANAAFIAAANPAAVLELVARVRAYEAALASVAQAGDDIVEMAESFVAARDVISLRNYGSNIASVSRRAAHAATKVAFDARRGGGGG